MPGLRKREITTKGPVFDYAADGHLRADQVRKNVYDFPPLATCRKKFAESLQQDLAWPENSEWAEWPTNFASGKFS